MAATLWGNQGLSKATEEMWWDTYGTRKGVQVSELMAGSKVQSAIRGRHKGTDLLRGRDGMRV
jgi:hypothetical protein